MREGKRAFVQFINGYSTGDLESKTKACPLGTIPERNLYNELYKILSAVVDNN